MAERPRPDAPRRADRTTACASRKARTTCAPSRSGRPARRRLPRPRRPPRPLRLGRRLALPSPSRRPTSRCATSTARSTRSPGAAGRPALVLFWATWAPPSVAALRALARQREALAAAGVSVLALSVDPREDEAKVREAAQGLRRARGDRRRRGRGRLERPPPPPVRPPRGPEAAHGFLVSGRGRGREALPRPSAPRDHGGRPRTIEASRPSASLARVPFPGTRTRARANAATSSTAWSCPSRASTCRRSAPSSGSPRLDPTAITFFNLGTLYMKAGPPAAGRAGLRARARAPARARRGRQQPGRAARAERRPAGARSSASRPRSQSDARFPRRAQQPRLRALPDGPGRRRRYELYEKALALQPDFPRGAQQPRHLLRPGRRPRARRPRLQAGGRGATRRYGEAGNNLALVLAAQGTPPARSLVLQRLLDSHPGVRARLRHAVARLSAGRAAGATPSRCWSCCCRGTRRTRRRSRRCRSSALEASGSRLAGAPGFRPGSSSPRCRARRSGGSRGPGTEGQPRVVDAQQVQHRRVQVVDVTTSSTAV